MIERRSFPATLAAAAEAEVWVGAESERRALAPNAAYALCLCVEELFVNAVRHGGAREIRLALDDDSLEFRDDGVAFDSTRPPPRRSDAEVGGFGLGLLQAFSADLAYAREAGWNMVRLALPKAAR